MNNEPAPFDGRLSSSMAQHSRLRVKDDDICGLKMEFGSCQLPKGHEDGTEHLAHTSKPRGFDANDARFRVTYHYADSRVPVDAGVSCALATAVDIAQRATGNGETRTIIRAEVVLDRAFVREPAEEVQL